MNKNNNPPIVQSITRSLFFDLAQKISDNPLTRVSRSTGNKVKSALDGSSTANYFVDIHMHAFNKKNIPSGFAMSAFGLPSELVDLAAAVFTKKTHQLVNASPTDILSDLLSNYNSVLSTHDTRPEIFLVLLMMDMQQGITGTIEEDQLHQLRTVLKIKNEFVYTYPLHNDKFIGKDHLLPFLAIDPNNPEAYNTFLSAFSKKINTTGESELDNVTPFVGIKIYPSLGYLPHHPTLMDIFEICEQKNIPVTAHAGGTRTHTSYDKVCLPRRIYNESDGTFHDLWQPEETNLIIGNRKRFKEIFLYPEIWKKVLYAYPNLKLNIAHFGSNDEWEAVENISDWNSIDQTLNLIHKNKSVYADFSYAFHKKENLKWLFKKVKDKPYLQSKVMYGSDFYLNEVEKGGTRDHLMNVLGLIDKTLQNKIFFENGFKFMFGVG
jgi:predicted TIM-barrel fold metal-dependent hydrolase